MTEYVSMISASVISYFFLFFWYTCSPPPLSLCVSAPFFLSLIYDLLSCVYHYKMTVEV